MRGGIGKDLQIGFEDGNGTDIRMREVHGTLYKYAEDAFQIGFIDI